MAQVSVHFLFALMLGNQTYLSINKLMDFILQKEPFSKYWDTSDKKYSILSMVTLYFESKDAVQEDLYGKINIKPIAIKLTNLTTNTSKTISHGKLLECFENRQPIVTIKPTKTRMIPNLQKRELAIVEIRTESREYEGHSNWNLQEPKNGEKYLGRQDRRFRKFPRIPSRRGTKRIRLNKH